MDPDSRPTTTERFRWRLVALGLAIVPIVLLPYFFAKRAIDTALHATEVLTHTALVKAETTELLYFVRDVEAASFARASGLRAAIFRERLETSMPRIGPRLDTLKLLVADNPGQLVRVGQLEAMVAGRRNLTEVALLEVDTGRLPEALTALDTAAQQFRIGDLAAEIIQAEESRLAERTEFAASKLRAAEWLAILSILAQLVLLAVVVWISERQVTQRQTAERDARVAVSRAQAIFQSVREPIILLDYGLHVLMHNDAFAQQYGVPTQDKTGAQSLATMGAGEWNDPVLLQRLADVAARDRELWDHELRQHSSDGIERSLVVNARRMQVLDQPHPVVLMTVADVTTHKRAEQQIRALNLQLEGKMGQVSEVNRELEAFSYSVSHDLRAPLRHIAGFADKLGRHLGESMDDTAGHYLDVIGTSARRMAGLIDDLLIYSRLGRHAMRLQTVDMQSLVDESRLVLGGELVGRNVEWRIQPLPIVVADENMMRQVWENLLSNAIKYTSRCERALIEISVASQDNGGLLFSVKDNGAGFDMDYADKLFGVFQRMHKESEFPGNGIGLANVRRILARHGGRIWAEAQPNVGATFHFSLPAQPGSNSDPGSLA